MPAFTRQELLDLQSEWKKALMLAATGKSYTLSDGGAMRTLTRYDLPEIRKTIDWLNAELAALESGRGPVFVRGVYGRVKRWR